MNPWLDRLRQQKCPGPQAPKPTKPEEGGFVGFVAPADGRSERTGETVTPSSQTPLFKPAPNPTAPRPNAAAIAVAALTRWLPPANETELDRMAQRERLAQSLGLDLHEAGRVADVLHLRDRSKDDRRLCAECQHLLQHGEDWGCVSPQGVSKTPTLLLVFLQPQRCAGFRQNPNWPANP